MIGLSLLAKNPQANVRIEPMTADGGKDSSRLNVGRNERRSAIRTPRIRGDQRARRGSQTLF